MTQCCSSAAMLQGLLGSISESKDETSAATAASAGNEDGADGFAALCNGQVRANCRFDEGADK